MTIYSVDDKDEVLNFEEIPHPSAGASSPFIIANDYSILLAYEASPHGEQYAVLKFILPYAHYFGSPNDESFEGHPLAQRGLLRYGVFEVRNSSWIRALERMNRVHPKHDARRFDERRHFIFTFHDSTFECVAGSLVVAETIQNDNNADKITHIIGRHFL